MPLIGNPLQSTNFVTDIFTGDAVTTAFTLSRPPASVVSIIIFIDGVKQSSSGVYTLSGNTLNFSAAPPNNAVIEVIHLGVQSLVNVPSLLSVTASSLADGAVTGPKLGLTAINANNIVDGTITGPKLGLTAINANNIVDGTITGPKLGLTAINANNIVLGTITGNLLANTVTTGNINLNGTTNFLNSVIESSNITTVMSATVTINISSPIVVFTANSSANSTVNFSGLAGVPVGNTASFVVIVPNSTSPKYISAYQVDGSSVTPKWQGGAPTTGTSANTDIYSFTVIKTAATPTYNVFASVASFF